MKFAVWFLYSTASTNPSPLFLAESLLCHHQEYIMKKQPRYTQVMSCEELEELYEVEPDLVWIGYEFDPAYIKYPFDRIILDVEQTAAQITKRVRKQLKHEGAL